MPAAGEGRLGFAGHRRHPGGLLPPAQRALCSGGSEDEGEAGGVGELAPVGGSVRLDGGAVRPPGGELLQDLAVPCEHGPRFASVVGDDGDGAGGLVGQPPQQRPRALALPVQAAGPGQQGADPSSRGGRCRDLALQDEGLEPGDGGGAGGDRQRQPQLRRCFRAGRYGTWAPGHAPDAVGQAPARVARPHLFDGLGGWGVEGRVRGVVPAVPRGCGARGCTDGVEQRGVPVVRSSSVSICGSPGSQRGWSVPSVCCTGGRDGRLARWRSGPWGGRSCVERCVTTCPVGDLLRPDPATTLKLVSTMVVVQETIV